MSLVFLGKDALKGKITRNDLQISYVLPASAEISTGSASELFPDAV